MSADVDAVIHLQSARDPVAGLPRWRFPLLTRDALQSAIVNSDDVPISAIIAPSGYGKSVLLSQAARQLAEEGQSVVWYDVDPGALADPDAMAAEVDRLLAMQPDVVCIDRSERLNVRDGHLFCERLMAGLGIDGRILSAGRERCPLSAIERKLRGETREWTESDLACTSSDVFDLMRLCGHASPELGLCGRLQKITQGWIAPIMLVSRALLAKPMLEPRICAGHLIPDIRNYLDENFFSHLPQAVQKALVAAATTDWFSPSLYQSLTEGEDFYTLEPRAALIQASAHSEQVFRIHRLFLRFLRERRDALPRATREAQHRRAARWFDTHDLPTEAAAHALESGDRELAVTIINGGARNFIAAGQITDALSWLRQFETSEIDRHPLIRLYTVTALTLNGRFEEARLENDRVRQSLEDDAPDIAEKDLAALSNQTLFHDALIAAWSREAINTGAVSDLIELMSTRRTWVFGEAMWIKGVLHFQAGQYGRAREFLTRSETPLTDTESWYALTVCRILLARMDRDAGELDRAEARCLRCLDEVTASAGVDVSVNAMTRTMLATLAFDRGNARDAHVYLAAARDGLARLASPEWDVRARLTLARIAIAQGKTSDVLDLLEEACHRSGAHHIPNLQAQARRIYVHFMMSRGQYAKAADVAIDPGIVPRDAGMRPSEVNKARLIDHITAMRLDLYSGSDQKQVSDAQAVKRVADMLGVVHLSLDATILEAEALLFANDRVKALRSLRDAALLAQKGGFDRLFLDAATPSLVELATELVDRQESQPEYASVLDAGLLHKFIGRTAEADAVVLPNSGTGTLHQHNLTEKEMEVLSLIDGGLTNQQIASELFISIGTVKWHVRNILNKLGAQNRTSAVRIAKSPIGPLS